MNDHNHKQTLPTGTVLNSYRLLNVLGVGGFGITYLGEHATLGHRVAVKEYLPNEFAIRDGATVAPKSGADQDAFDWGLERFLDEAQTLTRFRHPNLVRVSDYFEANRTAYLVMDYEDGEPLDKLLDLHGTLTEAQLKRVVLPLTDGPEAGARGRLPAPGHQAAERLCTACGRVAGAAGFRRGAPGAGPQVAESDGGGDGGIFAAGAVRERRRAGAVDGHLYPVGAMLPGDYRESAGGGAAPAKPVAARAIGPVAEVGWLGYGEGVLGVFP